MVWYDFTPYANGPPKHFANVCSSKSAGPILALRHVWFLDTTVGHRGKREWGRGVNLSPVPPREQLYQGLNDRINLQNTETVELRKLMALENMSK